MEEEKYNIAPKLEEDNKNKEIEEEIEKNLQMNILSNALSELTLGNSDSDDSFLGESYAEPTDMELEENKNTKLFKLIAEHNKNLTSQNNNTGENPTDLPSKKSHLNNDNNMW